MENNDIIENFGELPAEERARLVARQEANEWASIERKARELEQLEAKVLQLEKLAARREAFALRLREQVEAAEREDALLRREKELILAA
jgi:hypothetical protein